MSLALIHEAAKEVRRLAIAGSALAVGDFRLRKLAAPLEKAGEKVPVLAQAGKAIKEVVNGKEADSAANLLSLSTLLNAILYTQGQFSVTGEVHELEAYTLNIAGTRIPSSRLNELVQALTAPGGRFGIVKAAIERGEFHDVRLIEPAIQALRYSELADLVMEKVLPGYGAGIVPLLKSRLDLTGGQFDARCLQVMHQLDPDGTLDTCKQAFEEGSSEVKNVAIACLAGHEDCLPLILEQARSRSPTLRIAAIAALAPYDRPEITRFFLELIKGKSLAILAGDSRTLRVQSHALPGPLYTLRNPQVLNALLDEGQRVLDLVVNGDREQILRCCDIIDCLLDRKEVEVENFLLTCFNQRDKVIKLKPAKNSYVAGSDIITRAAQLLSKGSPKALKAVLASRDEVPPGALDDVVSNAWRVWPREKVYKEFAPLLRHKSGVGEEKGEAVETAFFQTRPAVWCGFPGLDWDFDLKAWESWDPRWLDAAIKADRRHLVCLLARPHHKGVVKYLLKRVDLNEPDDAGLTIATLSRIQYPNLTDVYLDFLERSIKNSRGGFKHQVFFLIEKAKHLPPADLPRLEAFVTRLPERFLEDFHAAIAPLRTQTH